MILRSAISKGRVLRCLAAASLAIGATTVGAVAVPAAAHADDAEFASAATATIHPGVMVESPVGQCTANFVFGDGNTLYLGQAAHCTGTGTASETDGCKSKSLPLGTKIKIQGASQPGELVYNSWLTMADKGESDANTCAYNDFALVKIDSADNDKVSPQVPVFGGPTGLRDVGLPAGTPVYSYQNSSLRQGLGLLSPKQGLNLGDSGGGYTHEVATITPGVPGDSGSGFMDPDGKAFGILSTLNLEPAPGTNGVGDLAREVHYAQENGDDMSDVELQTGGPFHPPLPLPSLATSSPQAASDSDTDGDSDASATSAAAPDRGMSISPRQSEPNVTPARQGGSSPAQQPGVIGGL